LKLNIPLKGNQELPKSLLKTCYIDHNSENSYQLKKKHMYYRQVQLGMVMTNVNDCDFIIYSSFEDKIVTINVSIGTNYAKYIIY